MLMGIGLSPCIDEGVGVGSPAAPPSFASASPNTGTAAGGLQVTIRGADFVTGCAATLGGLAAVAAFVSSTEITITTPVAVSLGVKNIVITNPDAQTSGASGTAAFTYTASALNIASISPTTGPTAGGTPVAIGGTGFLGRASAELGGVAVTSFAVVNDIQITGVSGAHAAGAVNVTVDGLDPTSGYTYAVPVSAPVITSISRSLSDPVGQPGGVADIIITGTDMSGVTNVKFGTTNANATVDSNTQVTTQVPAHVLGSAPITAIAGVLVSNAVAHEYWNPTVAGVTSFARKPNYAVAAGTGTWVATSGSNIVESALEPVATAGAPDFNGGTDRLQMPANAGTLFGTVSTAGGTFACVIDLDAYVVGAANTVVSNSAVTFAVLLEPGPVANFYYSDGSYKNAGPLTVPASGRIALVCRRNVTGTPFIEMTKDGGATWVGSVGTTAVGNLLSPATDLYLGSQGIYPLNAKFLAEAFNTAAWSNANVAKFHVWQLSTFP